MKKSIFNLGKVLTKNEQKEIKGGITCHHVSADFDIKVSEDHLGHRLYVDGKFVKYLSGNIEAHNYCSTAKKLEADEMR
ncbi:hypothetical protein [uncultured Tenacibaculum sp.]|uniref:hypothetical protein n=1 Tax=uncultured Tenacibaculum sp. TaxID=174713 RepID=UPI00262D8D34|nr:hypothetical protein [uncultured Tenacibaculum sp.]